LTTTSNIFINKELTNQCEQGFLSKQLCIEILSKQIWQPVGQRPINTQKKAKKNKYIYKEARLGVDTSTYVQS